MDLCSSQVELDGQMLPEVHNNVVFKETGASNSVSMKVRVFLSYHNRITKVPVNYTAQTATPPLMPHLSSFFLCAPPPHAPQGFPCAQALQKLHAGFRMEEEAIVLLLLTPPEGACFGCAVCALYPGVAALVIYSLLSIALLTLKAEARVAANVLH